MKVDIIIPNYNGAHLIKKNLPYVFAALEEYKGKVIVVDDGSKAEDKKVLRDVVNEYNTNNIQLYEHPRNKGFSSAVNTGVKQSEGDYVVLLNSDVKPEKNFLRSPLNHLENNSKLFAVGCMDKSVEGKEIVLRGRGIGKWRKGLVMHGKGEVDKEDTFWVSGGSSVFRREIYVLLGGMDEIYDPFYWEDIDLSYRAQKSGYGIIFDNKSAVKHYHEEGAIKSNFSEKRITTTAYRNQFIFIWKNITSYKLFCEHIFFLPLHIISSLKTGDTNLIKGLFLAIKLLPAIIKKRKIQRKLYKISDGDIL